MRAHTNTGSEYPNMEMTPATNLHLLRRDLANYRSLARFAAQGSCFGLPEANSYVQRFVRPDARLIHLASMFLRGKSYAQAEPRCNPFVRINWHRLRAYIDEYGVQPYAWDPDARKLVKSTIEDFVLARGEEDRLFQAWFAAATTHREAQEDAWRARQHELQNREKPVHGTGAWTLGADGHYHAPDSQCRGVVSE